jgi:hypothetical protein
VFTLFVGLIVAAVYMLTGDDHMRATDAGLYAMFVTWAITSGLQALLGLFVFVVGFPMDDAKAVGIGFINLLFYLPLNLLGCFGLYIVAAAFSPEEQNIGAIVLGATIAVASYLVLKAFSSGVSKAIDKDKD